MSERFQRLVPDCAEGLTAAEIAREMPRPPRGDRPFLAVNFVATADGRATVAGRTSPISNRADSELFHTLRTRFDAVMVGAQTVRVEGYGPMAQTAILVSRSLDVPPDVGLLAAPGNRVLVLTPSPGGELPATVADVSYLREPDLATAMRRLRAEHGIDSVLCEGGPQPAGEPDRRPRGRRAAPRLRGQAGRRPGPVDRPRRRAAAAAARARADLVARVGRLPVRPVCALALDAGGGVRGAHGL
jgi:RibD C-terminal domain